MYINDISLPNIKIKQLYIKWNEKIDVSIDEISISKKKSKKEKAIEYKNIEKYFKILSLSDDWFESITVEKIFFDNISASFKYKYGENGFVQASSKDFQLNSSLYFESELLIINIDELKDLKRKININGTVYFNANKLEANTNLYIDINKDLNLTLLANADTNKLTYKIKSHKSITSIEHLVDILHLPKEIRYWLIDAIDMAHLDITKAVGFIEYDNTSQAYKNIKIQATINKLNYTYDKALDAIHTQTTDLEFKEGILYIYPRKAYSYGMFLDKSWLKIDFTTKDEILTLHLLFNAKVDKNILEILNRYKIKLPFLQREGEVTTSLTLMVNLISLDIDAKGDFFTKKANFDYLGLNIDIFDAYIKLNNSDIQINNMKAKYKDIATTEVDVKYNTSTSQGTIFFRPIHIGFFEEALSLARTPMNITYNIAPNNDTIDIDASTWIYDDLLINLDKITVPFDLDTLQIKLPETFFTIDNIGSGFIAGNIAVDTMKLNLRADLLKFKYANIELSQSSTLLNISYDDTIHISSHSNILFDIDGFKFDLNNIEIEIENANISVKHANLLSIDGLLSTEINAFYNTKNNIGIFSLQNLLIKDKDTLLYANDKAICSLSSKDGVVNIDSKDLGISIKIKEDGWQTKIHSLSKISINSQFLQSLKIKEGKGILEKNINEKSIRMNADIIYPYGFLIENNKPLRKYKIKGKFNSKKSFFTINNKVSLKVDDNIKVNIKDSQINISEVLDFLNDINTSSSSTEENYTIAMNAFNSSLYLGNKRNVISDKIELQYHNGIMTAQLKYKNGHAGFKLDNNTFHLYGEKFNDQFMNELFSFSKLKGGQLKFSMNGSLDNYDGLFYLQNTKILDYIIINNILAFVNTVPSLATFSLPGYSKSGLKVKNAYLYFNAKNGVFNISDFYLDSKEIDILGSGTADLNKNEIDLILNLKTDLGSSLSKIPVVGYILFNKDSITTTMSVTGKLSDPSVKSLIVQDLVIAPINILKRALLLPYNLLKPQKENNITK